MPCPGQPRKGIQEGEILGAYDVPATMLIEEIAREFKEKNELKEPKFTGYIKSGAHRERAPLRKDWWYLRSASIFYRIFKDGPVGTERLRTYYGGKRNRGVKPEHFRKSSGKVIRTCLQELEKTGYVRKGKKGRVITPKGQSYLNEISKKIAPEWADFLKHEHMAKAAKVFAKKETEAAPLKEQHAQAQKPKEKEMHAVKTEGKKEGAEQRQKQEMPAHAKEKMREGGKAKEAKAQEKK